MQGIIVKIKGMIALNNKMRKSQTKKEIMLEHKLSLNKTIIDTYEKLNKRNKWATDIEVVRSEQESILNDLGFKDIKFAKKLYKEEQKALFITQDLLKDLTLEKKEMENQIKRLSQLEKFGTKNEIDVAFIEDMRKKYEI